MFSKTFVVLSLTIFSVALARVASDAPSDSGSSAFQDFFEVAGNNFKELQSTVMKVLGVENAEQLEKKAVDQGKEFAGKLDEWANDIKKQTEDLKDNASIKELRSSVDKAIEDFKLQHPDTTEDIKNFVDKANKGAEEIIGKIKNLNESQDAQNVKELGEKLLNSAASTFETISKELSENIKS